MNYSLKKLGALTEVITKGTTPSNIGEDFSETGIMYFRSELIGKSKYIDKSIGLLYISESTHRKLKRSQIHSGDMLFSMAGAYLGKISLARDEDIPANTNQAVAIIRFIPGSCNIEYVYYYMMQSWYNNYISSFNSQAAQPNINLSQIGKLIVNIPNRLIQNRIVSVLSAYDSLIENNNKRIKVLEHMAENLYKEWFVRFRFPGHENAEFENGIPKGWTRKKIKDYYYTTSGGTPSRNNEEFFNDGTIPWVKTGEIKDSIILDTEEHITESAISKSAAKILPKDCIIMAMYGVNIGMLSYLSKEMSCNQACCAFTDKRNFSSRHYLFHYMKSIREYLLLIGFGAAQQNLSQDLIKRIRITMPSDEIVKLFEKRINDYYNQIYNLLKQNRNLIKQRDLLLPRLMSGKLEV